MVYGRLVHRLAPTDPGPLSWIWLVPTTLLGRRWQRQNGALSLRRKKGKRFEIWVTAVGELETRARLSRLGPCDKKGSRYSGYGHLGAFPAKLVVTSFRDIEILENPKSPYDYGNKYRGPL